MTRRAAERRVTAATVAPRAHDTDVKAYLTGVLSAALAGNLVAATRVHDTFWGSAAPAFTLAANAVPHGGQRDSPLARSELHLLRAHALAMCRRPPAPSSL